MLGQTNGRTDAVPFHRPAAQHTMRAVPLACRQSGWIATRIKMTARILLPKTVVNTFGSLSFELINLKLCKTRRHSLERVLPSRHTEIGNVVTITEQIHRHWFSRMCNTTGNWFSTLYCHFWLNQTITTKCTRICSVSLYLNPTKSNLPKHQKYPWFKNCLANKLTNKNSNEKGVNGKVAEATDMTENSRCSNDVSVLAMVCGIICRKGPIRFQHNSLFKHYH